MSLGNKRSRGEAARTTAPLAGTTRGDALRVLWRRRLVGFANGLTLRPVCAGVAGCGNMVV